MRPISLRWRVSFVVTGAILFAFALNAVVAYLEMKEALIGSIDRTLQSMATSTLAVLENSQINAATEAEVSAIAGVSTHRPASCFRIWVDGNSTDLLAGYGDPAEQGKLLTASSLAHATPPPLGNYTLFSEGEAKKEYRAIWMRSRIRENEVNVVIAVSSRHAYSELAEQGSLLLILGGSVILITIVGTMFLVGLGLRPITQTAQALHAVTERNVGDTRISSDTAPVELRPFVRAVSDMLARLAYALTEQKRFVSDASHELRTPLTVARSTIDAALVKERTPAEYRNTLGEVREDLDRMGAMAEALLLLARLDETTPARELETFDLASLLEDLARRYETKAAQAGGCLNLALHPLNMRGDEAQISRLFSNLIDNAIQHGPKGGPVSVSITDEGDDVVVVYVHDEGGSIPAEELPHIFERFYRADRSRSRATGGVGLGLSIAKEIALRHGGDITAMSSPEAGTSFCVRLPKA